MTLAFDWMMGFRIARSCTFIAAVAGLAIGITLLLTSHPEVCPSLRAIACWPTPLWATTDLYADVLWSSVPLLACFVVFTANTTPASRLLVTALAFAVESTCLIGAGPAPAFAGRPVSAEVVFAHFYALYVLPFQALAVLGFSWDWLDSRLGARSPSRR